MLVNGLTGGIVVAMGRMNSMVVTFLLWMDTYIVYVCLKEKTSLRSFMTFFFLTHAHPCLPSRRYIFNMESNALFSLRCNQLNRQTDVSIHRNIYFKTHLYVGILSYTFDYW